MNLIRKWLKKHLRKLLEIDEDNTPAPKVYKQDKDFINLFSTQEVGKLKKLAEEKKTLLRRLDIVDEQISDILYDAKKLELKE